MLQIRLGGDDSLEQNKYALFHLRASKTKVLFAFMRARNKKDMEKDLPMPGEPVTTSCDALKAACQISRCYLNEEPWVESKLVFNGKISIPAAFADATLVIIFLSTQFEAVSG